MSNIKSIIKNYKWDLTIIIVIVIMFSIFSYKFSILYIKGNSMYPTYRDRDILILSKSNEVKKNNIVVFNPPSSWLINNKTFIKRISGVPGDRIKINDSGIKINDEFIEYDLKDCNNNSMEFTINSDEYLVLGDNKGNSDDSIYQYCIGNKSFLINKANIKLKGQEFFSMKGVLN